MLDLFDPMALGASVRGDIMGEQQPGRSEQEAEQEEEPILPKQSGHVMPIV
jgi:hypothetical protein